MKVAIWGSYGVIRFPKDFDVNKEKDIIKSREELAKFLENNVKDRIVLEDYEESKRETELRRSIKESEHKCVIVKVREDIRYYVISKNRVLGFWYIFDIDTSKLWLFDEYDGLEYIRYYRLSENNRLRKEEN